MGWIRKSQHHRHSGNLQGRLYFTFWAVSWCLAELKTSQCCCFNPSGPPCQNISEYTLGLLVIQELLSISAVWNQTRIFNNLQTPGWFWKLKLWQNKLRRLRCYLQCHPAWHVLLTGFNGMTGGVTAGVYSADMPEVTTVTWRNIQHLIKIKLSFNISSEWKLT